MNENITVHIPQLERDIPPDSFMDQVWLTPLGWSLLATLAVVLIALAVWLMVRKKRPAPPLPTQEELALSAIDRLEADLPPLRECSLRLSMILRSFLTGEAKDPALFETHQEFNLRVDALSSLPEPVQQPTRELLEIMAEIKYAGDVPQDRDKARQLCEDTRALIERIHSSRVPEAPSTHA